jgi:hypothetical protein
MARKRCAVVCCHRCGVQQHAVVGLIGTHGKGEHMGRTRGSDATAGVQAAEVVREYGPFSDAPKCTG